MNNNKANYYENIISTPRPYTPRFATSSFPLDPFNGRIYRPLEKSPYHNVRPGNFYPPRYEERPPQYEGRFRVPKPRGPIEEHPRFEERPPQYEGRFRVPKPQDPTYERYEPETKGDSLLRRLNLRSGPFELKNFKGSLKSCYDSIVIKGSSGSSKRRFEFILRRDHVEMIAGYSTEGIKVPIREFNFDVMDNFIKRNLKSSFEKEQAHEAELMASVCFSKSDISQQAKKFGFDPDMLVGDYSKRQIEKLLNYYNIDQSKANSPDYNSYERKTIAQLIKKIEKLKKSGLSSRVGPPRTISLLQKMLKHSDLSRREAELIEQFISDLKYPSYRRKGKICEREALAYTQGILSKVIQEEGSDGNTFMSAGWPGHHVTLSIEKIDNKIRIVVTNAGSGSELHRRVYEGKTKDGYPKQSKEKVIPVKIYETDDINIAERVISDLILLKSNSKKSADNKNKFYNIFQKMEELEDYSIPARVAQRVGNCVLRSEFERIYYILQKKGKTDLANAFLAVVEDEIDFAAENNQALKKKLSNIPYKPVIDPLKANNNQRFEISDGRKRHCIPIANKKTKYSIGRLGRHST